MSTTRGATPSRLSMSTSPPASEKSRPSGLRVSQRPPTACRELQFLRGLRSRLVVAGRSGSSGDDGTQQGNDWDMRQAAVADIDARVRLLEHGKADDEDEVVAMVTPSPEAGPEMEQQQQQVSYGTINGANIPSTRSARPSIPVNIDSSSQASVVVAFEFLAWGRNIKGCFPHRRCNCYQHRRYSELVSINCDEAWVGRLAMTVTVPVDADVLLPAAVARKVVQFHLNHLHWHHNAFHAPTFLARCQQFWSTGTTDHPLWLALYLAVCSVSLWALLNAERHREALGLDNGAAGGSLADLNEALVERQFQAMVAVLYGGNFLEHLSLYSVQAIVISTHIAHNLDRSELNATLIGAAVQIAHSLGLHKISDPPTLENGGKGTDTAVGWHERVEIETGKRVWAQLLIQDHFQIPFTNSYGGWRVLRSRSGISAG
ncbi:c6 zinc finger domain containing protein [Grosmannia clavigera kw1407]|uniref:C6 zinc finger domain containing protein n=1 Tax=Grosmannia clavigera (strain kw1407 / UAMH 11150) TaxID=655863 RepID=F0X7T7_GROCL|nr:c6 zinc finger domain containing protein [Grosmannia clavigera kw1407]EFX06586.1 c6 zinc finger domain containing protein [Grosmannia clavigera kw1407]